MPRLLFLAGIPASGKSHFGQWLEAECGYLHIDAEIPNELERLSLREAWDEACKTQDCSRFARVLLDSGRPSVFNWGFPVGCLPLVVALKHAGFSTWWFDADLPAARVEHIASGKPAQSFDNQVRAIQACQNEITAQLAPNTICTLTPNGHRVPAKVILSAIRHAV